MSLIYLGSFVFLILKLNLQVISYPFLCFPNTHKGSSLLPHLHCTSRLLRVGFEISFSWSLPGLTPELLGHFCIYM